MQVNDYLHMIKSITCKYCDDCLIVPSSWVERLLGKYIKKFLDGKNLDYQIGNLKMLIKMCPNIESYILYHYRKAYDCFGPLYYSTIGPEAAYFLRRSYLHDRKDTIKSEMISCDYCGYDACNFHIYYGGFIFDKCNQPSCPRNISICGWCQEKVVRGYERKCIHCYRFCMTNLNKTKLVIEGRQSIYICDRSNVKLLENTIISNHNIHGNYSNRDKEKEFTIWPDDESDSYSDSDENADEFSFSFGSLDIDDYIDHDLDIEFDNIDVKIIIDTNKNK